MLKGMARQNYLFTNWAKTQHCRPVRYCTPTREEELVELVADAAESGASIRVVGAGHSWSDIVLTDQWLVNLDAYDRLIDVDKEAMTVSVQAGMRLKVLNEHLAREGLALSAQGSVAEQSIGGLIGTGTHGTGLRFPNFSAMVVSLSLVSAEGEIIVLNEADGELFNAAALSLGALGILSTVCLRVEEAFRLEERSWTLSFDEAVQEVDSLIEEHEHLKLWWVPHTDLVQVFSQNRTSAPATRKSLRERWEASFGPRLLFAFILAAGRVMPWLVSSLNWFMARSHFHNYRRVAPSHEIFNIPMPPRHDETEWGIAAERTSEAMTRLRALIKEGGHRVNFVIELRFVAADEILLSPAYRRASCQLGAYAARGTRANKAYFDAFQALALEMDGRPHWGKVVSLGRSALESVVPNLNRFEAIRARMDPRQRFTNAFIERVFQKPRA